MFGGQRMPYAALAVETADQVTTITLNRPEKRNALSREMITEILAVLDEIEVSNSRVAIITGAGRAFCSGLDLDALSTIASQSPDENLADTRHTARLFRRLWSYPKILIAAVNGPAIAGGCGVATLCDFTLAAPDARFGYTEVRIGFIPALVGLFLERQVGEKIARDLLLTGRILEADEAHKLGLVTRVVPADLLVESARELGATLIGNSPGGLTATKRLIVQPSEAEVDRHIELAIAESVAIRATPDFREGLASFLEKRKPNWSVR